MADRRVPDPELHEVAPGTFAYVQPDGSWMLNNTGIVAAEGAGHLLVDMTSTEARNRALLARAAAVTGGGDPHALVNTHHHGDHTFGNWLMPRSVPVIGHVLSREDQIEAGLRSAQVFVTDYGHLEVRPPDLTFEGRMVLHLGDQVVELIHVGPAHTRGDLVVWLPGRRVAFAGDLVFNGGHPFLLEGSLRGFLPAMARLRELGADVLVPGHGPVCRGSEVDQAIDDMVRYVTFVEQLASEGRAAGRSPLEVARGAELGEFATWQEGERLVGNLHRAYHEQGGNPPGSRLAVAEAFADMLAYHGGPIPCLA